METVRCRICWEQDSPNEMLRPCKCKGSMGHVHAECWKTAHFACSLCNYTAPTLRHGSILQQTSMLVDLIKARRKSLLFGITSMVRDSIFLTRCVAMCHVLPLWAVALITALHYTFTSSKPTIHRCISYGLLMTSLYFLERSHYGRVLAQVCSLFVSMRIFLGAIYYNEKLVQLCATMLQAYYANT